jgi:hypothetical protein
VIGKSIVQLVLQQFVHAINVISKNQLQWFEGDSILHVMEGFKDLSSLPRIQGVSNVTQIRI